MMVAPPDAARPHPASQSQSYPVTLAVFTALLAGQLADFLMGTGRRLRRAALPGFIAADLALLVWLVRRRARAALSPARDLDHFATGVMFLGLPPMRSGTPGRAGQRRRGGREGERSHSPLLLSPSPPFRERGERGVPS
jgi:hypothetical protein